MRILVIGGKGMLGHKLVQVLGAKFDVWTTTRGDFAEIDRYGIFNRDRTFEYVDVTDLRSVLHALEVSNPAVVINAAGVIKQAPAAQDAVQTLKVNSIFPQRLAEISHEHGFRLITVSTDCVFSGNTGNYTEADTPDAGDLYGISKFLGEVKTERSLTIRTSVIGRELATAHSLVEWFLTNRGTGVKGYVNAIYTGFPAIILAEIISSVITDHPDLSGLYHVSSEPISKFDLLELLNTHYDAGAEIEPFEDYVVDRSLDSSIFRNITGFSPAGWDQMIEQMAADPTPYDAWRT